MRYRVKVERENEDGGSETAGLGQVETGLCLTESDVGLKLVAAQEIMARLQMAVTTQQLRRHCQATRCCLSCQAPRNLKDYRTRTLDTVLGRMGSMLLVLIAAGSAGCEEWVAFDPAFALTHA
ncbi:MAG: hypothetical protein M3O09_17710, partial [Acidobacteriota bacterium]|nr:hypothetical protein [Acidobacteriota bacterium]